MFTLATIVPAATVGCVGEVARPEQALLFAGDRHEEDRPPRLRARFL